jgi:hypothetical protein
MPGRGHGHDNGVRRRHRLRSDGDAPGNKREHGNCACAASAPEAGRRRIIDRTCAPTAGIVHGERRTDEHA